MYEALLEVMEPEIKKIERKSGIISGIELLRECGYCEEEIKRAVVKKFQLSEEEIKEYLLQKG